MNTSLLILIDTLACMSLNIFFYGFPYDVIFFFKVFMNVSALTFDLIESKVVPFDFLALLLACVIHLSLIHI